MGWGAIAAAAGSIIGKGLITGAQNKKQRTWASDMSDKSWQRTLDLRKMDNEYNTPQSQMQRLKQAGINKLLPFIGGGSASGGQAASAHSAPEAKTSPIPMTGGTQISDIYDLQLKKAGTDKIIEETSGLKIANERALVTWLQDKGFIKETQAAAAAQKIAESGLKDLELGVATGQDAYYRTQTKGSISEGGRDITGGYAKGSIEHETIKKANNLIDANAQNVQAQNMARKALKEWLENPQGGWNALKTALLVILTK